MAKKPQEKKYRLDIITDAIASDAEIEENIKRIVERNKRNGTLGPNSPHLSPPVVIQTKEKKMQSFTRPDLSKVKFPGYYQAVFDLLETREFASLSDLHAAACEKSGEAPSKSALSKFALSHNIKLPSISEDERIARVRQAKKSKAGQPGTVARLKAEVERLTSRLEQAETLGETCAENRIAELSAENAMLRVKLEHAEFVVVSEKELGPKFDSKTEALNFIREDAILRARRDLCQLKYILLAVVSEYSPRVEINVEL